MESVVNKLKMSENMVGKCQKMLENVGIVEKTSAFSQVGFGRSFQPFGQDYLGVGASADRTCSRDELEADEKVIKIKTEQKEV